jgi:NADH dehydrogenase
LAEIAGEPRTAFEYKDKGIMAMIGRGAAVAEVGKHRHELHGSIAFAAWLGVHAALMSGVRNRVEAFVDWGWDYFSKTRGPQVLDRRSAAAHIDWGDSDDVEVGSTPRARSAV